MPIGVYKRLSCEERFKNLIHKNEETGCWDWLGSKDNGYGVYHVNRKKTSAHRYSWILVNGIIPKGIIIRHKCRGKCVNPEHLELGTNKDNSSDMKRDGTALIGEHHPCSKLTDDIVRQIKANIPPITTRILYRSERAYYLREMAVLFDTTYGCMKDIAGGRTWKHIKV